MDKKHFCVNNSETNQNICDTQCWLCTIKAGIIIIHEGNINISRPIDANFEKYKT